jgi:hypothetical protein
MKIIRAMQHIVGVQAIEQSVSITVWAMIDINVHCQRKPMVAVQDKTHVLTVVMKMVRAMQHTVNVRVIAQWD